MYLFDRRLFCWPRLGRMLGVCLVTSCIFFFTACTHHPEIQSNPSLYEDFLSVYREPLNHLAAVRRGACPMYPSCSEYSRQAVERHGFVIGWSMAMDRLLRCGRDELRRAPTIRVNGEWKFYDPLSANDGWWYSAGDVANPSIQGPRSFLPRFNCSTNRVLSSVRAIDDCHNNVPVRGSSHP